MSINCTVTPTGPILVADGAPLFRRGLLQVLSQCFAAHRLCEAANLAELMEFTCHQLPGLVIMSAELPGASATPWAAMTALREVNPQVAVVIINNPTTTAVSVILRLLQQHVNAFLPSTASIEEVRETVDAVLQRGWFHNEYIVGLLQNHQLPPDKQSGIIGFSSRQLEVLHLVAKELSNDEIADCLCTSVRTVEYHRSQMLQKAGVRTTMGLVLYAERQGLLAANGQAFTTQNSRFQMLNKS